MYLRLDFEYGLMCHEYGPTCQNVSLSSPTERHRDEPPTRSVVVNAVDDDRWTLTSTLVSIPAHSVRPEVASPGTAKSLPSDTVIAMPCHASVRTRSLFAIERLNHSSPAQYVVACLDLERRCLNLGPSISQSQHELLNPARQGRSAVTVHEMM